MEKVLIVRLGAMGDVLHALPAAAALRRAHPDVEMGWLVEERWAELLHARGSPPHPHRSVQKPLVDAIHLADTRLWRRDWVRGWRGALELRRELRDAGYDLVIDLQGALKSAALARMAGKNVTGPAAPRESAAAWFYSQKIVASAQHIVDQSIEVALAAKSAAAASPQMNLRPTPDLLPSDPAAERWCDSELARRTIKMNASRFAVLNPGAGWGAKVWPAGRYGEVASALAREGVASIINAGPGESALASEVEAASNGAAERIGCSIGQLIALIRRAALFVGGDTGPMHLANALGVPVVALFGPTDPARNGPYYKPSVVLRNAGSTTSYSHAAAEDAGLAQISAGEVIEAALGLLRTAATHRAIPPTPAKENKP